MDDQTRSSIISAHAHLISSPPPSPKISTRTLVREIQSKPGTGTPLEDSGPPSPRFGVVKNFGEVVPGKIYRSSYPYASNLDFLKELGLKTILSLVDAKNDTVEFKAWMEQERINNLRIVVPAHKTPESLIPISTVVAVQSVLANEEYHPILVHCNKGKHRTGCMIATFRALNNWPLDSILAEYRQYAGDKWRTLDDIFIRNLDVQLLRERLTNERKSDGSSSTSSDPQQGTEIKQGARDKDEKCAQGLLPTPPQSEKDWAGSRDSDADADAECQDMEEELEEKNGKRQEIV